MDNFQSLYERQAKAMQMLMKAKDGLQWQPCNTLFYTTSEIARKKLMKIKVYERLKKYITNIQKEILKNI